MSMAEHGAPLAGLVLEPAELLHQLERERDRLRLLLDLNNNIVSILDLRELLRAISTNVRRVMQCDYTSVTLREPGEERRLRVYARHF